MGRVNPLAVVHASANMPLPNTRARVATPTQVCFPFPETDSYSFGIVLSTGSRLPEYRVSDLRASMMSERQMPRSTKKRLTAAACFGSAVPLGFFGLLTISTTACESPDSDSTANASSVCSNDESRLDRTTAISPGSFTTICGISPLVDLGSQW